MNTLKTCTVYRLGQLNYIESQKLQQEFVTLRKDGSIGDCLLLLEHPPVITLGRHASLENIAASVSQLESLGIPVIRSRRGGEATCHMPGQQVVYPIINLKEAKIGVGDYVWMLEEVVIRTLMGFAIDGRRVAGKRGVWVGGEKICSLGLRVSGGVASHGFALNVNPDLTYFDYIIPCGIKEVKMNSITHLLGRNVTIKEVEPELLASFTKVFQYDIGFKENNPAECHKLI